MDYARTHSIRLVVLDANAERNRTSGTAADGIASHCSDSNHGRDEPNVRNKALGIKAGRWETNH
jgi:hypothetical protein